MATKLTVPELNKAIYLVIANNLYLVTLPVNTITFEEFHQQLTEEEYSKIQSSTFNIPDGSELNFLCGAYAVTLVHNAKLSLPSDVVSSTLFLQHPTVTQVGKQQFHVSASLLTLEKEHMDDLLSRFCIQKEDTDKLPLEQEATDEVHLQSANS